jgi:hypothetical protein
VVSSSSSLLIVKPVVGVTKVTGPTNPELASKVSVKAVLLVVLVEPEVGEP